MYTAYIRGGYTLTRIDERFQLEKKMKTLRQDLLENKGSFDKGNGISELGSYVNNLDKAGISELESYMNNLDEATLQRYRNIRSKKPCL